MIFTTVVRVQMARGMKKTQTLRAYEAFFILPASLDDVGIRSILDRFTKYIEEQGGEVKSAGLWDKRPLAYPIKGHTEGSYCLVEFQAPPSLPNELGRLLRMSDEVIRARVFLKEEE